MLNSVLVCFAVPEEARFFTVPKPLQKSVEVLKTGIGCKNAVQSVERSLDRASPSLVLTCGFAGGLRPGLQVGSILFSSEADGRLERILVELGALPGRFHCSPKIVVTATEKSALWKNTGADAVEMESESICQVCHQRKIPSVTVRVISDSAEEDLPLDFNALMTPDEKIDYRKLAWSAFRSPKKIPALLRFQRQTRNAARKLGQKLEELLRCRRALGG